ncbi:hypothetical protein [Methanogenium organophilum]|uniref:Uncharacterized protein n=1 Tax=Methanogenium organophilum TaxID=2199 RepID=A0A9X9S2Z2_METOG|nr:hypothetical protein [Methanogenium organophilum]WAI00934.1 hypothetical protein OU421_11005 [Methanogenium organophilum]
MNKIAYPLNQGMQGPPVADLHNAMQVLLERSLILANDEAARRELAAALRRDRDRQSFNRATGKLVSVFQREWRLQPSGDVDRPTADALNKLLRELGLLDPERPPAFLLVTGVVHREDGVPLRGTRMQAAHVTDRRAIRLGDDSADAEGRTIGSSQVIPNAKPIETIDIIVPIAAPAVDHHTIQGAILLEHGLLAEKLKLRLYRRDFGDKTTLLSETTTVGATMLKSTRLFSKRQ